MKKIGKIFRESLVSHIKESVQGLDSTFLVNYSKVSAPQMNDFRKRMKQVGAEIFVAKNSFARLALQEFDSRELLTGLEGQTAFVWSNTNSLDVSKALVKFTKETGGILLKGAFVDGKILSKGDVECLSQLPSRDVLLSQLLQVIESPLTRLAGILNTKTRDLLSILKQLSERKEGK